MTARGWRRYKEVGEGWARAATLVQKKGAAWGGLRWQASPACSWPMVTARPAWLRTCLRKRQRNSSRPSLTRARCSPPAPPWPATPWPGTEHETRVHHPGAPGVGAGRSEERRVGQGGGVTCRSGWAPEHYKKKNNKK